MAHFKIIYGDSLEEIPKLEDNSIDCVFTSPDPLNLNTYGISATNNYPVTLVEILNELIPKLKDTGSLWLHQNEVSINEKLGGLPQLVITLMIHSGWLLRNVLAWYCGTDNENTYEDRLDVDWQHISNFAKSDKAFFRKFEKFGMVCKMESTKRMRGRYRLPQINHK